MLENSLTPESVRGALVTPSSPPEELGQDVRTDLRKVNNYRLHTKTIHPYNPVFIIPHIPRMATTNRGGCLWVIYTVSRYSVEKIFGLLYKTHETGRS